MNSIPESLSHGLTPRIVAAVPAANADDLGDQSSAFTETSSGWDSYEVWQRFIKGPRERRHGPQK